MCVQSDLILSPKIFILKSKQIVAIAKLESSTLAPHPTSYRVNKVGETRAYAYE
jgi:hypothetical protein